jgi:hypothetical protein
MDLLLLLLLLHDELLLLLLGEEGWEPFILLDLNGIGRRVGLGPFQGSCSLQFSPLWLVGLLRLLYWYEGMRSSRLLLLSLESLQ